MTCRHCGKETAEDWRYCPNCGKQPATGRNGSSIGFLAAILLAMVTVAWVMRPGTTASIAAPINAPSAPATEGPASDPPSKVPSPAKRFDILAVDSRVTESNNVYSRCAWRLTLRNDTDAPLTVGGEIEFQDSDGFAVDNDYVQATTLRPREERTLTGAALIKAESIAKVAKTMAKIREQ